MTDYYDSRRCADAHKLYDEACRTLFFSADSLAQDGALQAALLSDFSAARTARDEWYRQVGLPWPEAAREQSLP